MPRLNAKGEPTSGLFVSWYDDDRAIYQDCSPPACRIVLSDGTVIAPRPASPVIAQNRVWAGFLADGGVTGVFDSYGQSFPLSSLGTTVSEDGWYARKVLYQSSGPWLLQHDHRTLPLPDGDIDYADIHLVEGPHYAFARDRVLVCDVPLRVPVTRPLWAPRIVLADDGWHVLYQDMQTSALCIDNRVLQPPGDYFYTDAKFIDGAIRYTWSPNPANVYPEVRAIASSAIASLPPVETPPAPRDRAIGPVTPSRAADGRLYDLLPFILGDSALWPRRGPTHPQHQFVAGDLFHFVKFGNPQAYETWARDDNWIYHLEDSNYSFTDTRWFPRRMAIGEDRAFDTGPHETVQRDRATCRELGRGPVRRRMWLLALHDRWYWGPDLGERPTAVLVYDPTGGFHNPGRFIELYYCAHGAGWARWESYRSDLVYPVTGSGARASFPDSARSARSDFYLLGGPALAPALSGCVPQVCPRWPPVPAPVPVPPPPTSTPTPTPPPPAPEPPQGDSPMQFAVFNSQTVIPYKALKPSASQPGCVNVILPDDSVLSAHGDNRPPGTDGPWEAGQLIGEGIVTYRADGEYHTHQIVPVGKLP